MAAFKPSRLPWKLLAAGKPLRPSVAPANSSRCFLRGPISRPPVALAARPSIACEATLAATAFASSSLIGAFDALGTHACDTSFNTSSRVCAMDSIASTTRLSLGSKFSSNSLKKSRSSSSQASSLLQSSPPSASSSARFNVSRNSLCTSRSCARLLRRRLLTAARFWVETFSTHFIRSSTFPALSANLSSPSVTEAAPSWSMVSANPDAASRISANKLGPAPLRIDSSVPTVAVKALTTSSAIGRNALSLSWPSATEAEAPNLVTVC
mmetsp:Transcript_93990/g.265418  ORF Transcript_93990/g.265418 Transcript_93990/m.265418 type:complete len:268 (+) Transcript_93990:141-944(+)